MPGLPSVAASSQAWASVGAMWSTSLNEGWLPEWTVGSTGGFTVPCSPSSSGYIFYSTGDGTTGSGNSFYALGRRVRIVQGSTAFYGLIKAASIAAGVTTVSLTSGTFSPTAGLSTGVAFTSVAVGTESPQSLAGSTSSTGATKFHREDGTWAVPAGGVTGGQRSIAIINSVVTTTSATYVDLTGATASITPTGGDVSIDFNAVIYPSINTYGVYLQLVKDGTAMSTPPHAVVYNGGVGSQPQSLSMGHLDVAPTTAAHTYKIQWKNDTNGTASNGGYEMRLILVESPH